MSTKLHRILISMALLLWSMGVNAQYELNIPGSVEAFLQNPDKYNNSVGIIATFEQAQLPSAASQGTISPEEFDLLLKSANQSQMDNIMASLNTSGFLSTPEVTDFTPNLIVRVNSTGLRELLNRSDLVNVIINRPSKPFQGSTVEIDQLPDSPSLDISLARIFPNYLTSPYDGDGWAVAVLDTGSTYTHPFLSGKKIFEGCFSDGEVIGGGFDDSLISSFCPSGLTATTRAGSGLDCPTDVSGCGQ